MFKLYKIKEINDSTNLDSKILMNKGRRGKKYGLKCKELYTSLITPWCNILYTLPNWLVVFFCFFFSYPWQLGKDLNDKMETWQMLPSMLW